MKMHDPEAAAARYLGGDMTRRVRRRFERHILECPDCWEEVRLAGVGRGYAEAGRELAPQTLRDRIRGQVALLPAERRIRPGIVSGTLVVAVVLAVAGATFVLVRSSQPEAIAALVTDFREDGRLMTPAPAALPGRLGDLTLVGVEAGMVGELSVVGHRYRDPAGHRVTVYRADRTFPVAEGARPGNGETWRAEVDGAVLLCSDRPVPSLVVGDDGREVELTARVLGMV